MSSPKNLRLFALCVAANAVLLGGCGSTKSQRATEQLLVSDAIDRSIANIDFRDLAGQKVYFDTSYIKNVKGNDFSNAEYLISSLRQQMFAANCLLQDRPEDADYVVEARVGALGTDASDVVYGIPANNALNAASSLLPQAPALPTIPEIAVARRNAQLGAAKVGVFAYHRESKHVVWQSGISESRSTARDTWVLGAGPFQRGTIYEGTHFAGAKLGLPTLHIDDGMEPEAPLVSYHNEIHFATPTHPKSLRSIQMATFEEPILRIPNSIELVDPVDEPPSNAAPASSVSPGTAPPRLLEELEPPY